MAMTIHSQSDWKKARKSCRPALPATAKEPSLVHPAADQDKDKKPAVNVPAPAAHMARPAEYAEVVAIKQPVALVAPEEADFPAEGAAEAEEPRS